MARLPSPQAGCFCSPGSEFYGRYECRGTMLLNDSYLKIVTNVTKWVLTQCRGTKLIGARKLSRYTEFLLLADARACPERSEGSGGQNHYKFVLSAGAKVEESRFTG